MEFEWDPAKAAENLKKHKVSFTEAATVLVAYTDRGGRIRSSKKATGELRPEYDLPNLLKGGVKGKYAKQYHAGTNLVLIEPEIHDEFRTEKEVNDALRLVIELRRTGGPRRPA